MHLSAAASTGVHGVMVDYISSDETSAAVDVLFNSGVPPPLAPRARLFVTVSNSCNREGLAAKDINRKRLYIKTVHYQKYPSKQPILRKIFCSILHMVRWIMKNRRSKSIRSTVK